MRISNLIRRLAPVVAAVSTLVGSTAHAATCGRSILLAAPSEFWTWDAKEKAQYLKNTCAELGGQMDERVWYGNYKYEARGWGTTMSIGRCCLPARPAAPDATP